jgi:glycosyltransferase involved in cell wall biosynthesis
MKISIITVVKNRKSSIALSIKSYNSQIMKSGISKEHVILDGASTDGTLEIIHNVAEKSTRVFSEVDYGLYDALNKAISIADGDVIGLLHSDDCFFDSNVLEKIGIYLLNRPDIDIVYGGVVYVNNMQESKIVRKHKMKNFRPWMLTFGMMPPHTSMFIRKRVFEQIGFYSTKYKISSDFDFLCRYCCSMPFSMEYIDITTTKMSFGGISNDGWKSKILLNREIRDACKKNRITTSYLMIYLKYFFKIFEFINPLINRMKW